MNRSQRESPLHTINTQHFSPRPQFCLFLRSFSLPLYSSLLSHSSQKGDPDTRTPVPALTSRLPVIQFLFWSFFTPAVYVHRKISGMEKGVGGIASRMSGIVGFLIRKCIYRILSVGPIPNHIAFIMDGNRRYAKKWNLEEGAGHKAGFLALISVLRYCYEWGFKYVTIYAFSIDNFKRRPEEVQYVMDLMQEKIEGLIKEESIVNQYGVRVYFIGNLKLLSEPVRVAAERAMMATANNTKAVLLICVAYASSDEIMHAVQESCMEKLDKIQASNANRACNGVTQGIEGSEKTLEEAPIIKLVDLEKHMYMAVAPDPDIVIRSSGEARMSNFLIWQTTNCLLYCPTALWPDIGLRHLIWAVLKFQRCHSYLEKKKKQL